MRCEQVHPVIAPAARAGELGDRQQLDRVHAEAHEVAEVPDRPVERPLRRERADVALVQHRPGQRQPPPAAVGPGEGLVVDNPGRSVDALRLKGRARVRTRRSSIYPERVVRARSGAVDGTRPPASMPRPHRHLAPAGDNVHAALAGSPHPELVHQTSLPRMATGNPRRRPVTSSRPPSTVAPVSTSAHGPGGSSTVVPAHPWVTSWTSRGTTTASPLLRVKATMFDDLGPAEFSRSYPEAGPCAPGWRCRCPSTRWMSQSFGPPSASRARAASGPASARLSSNARRR